MGYVIDLLTGEHLFTDEANLVYSKDEIILEEIRSSGLASSEADVKTASWLLRIAAKQRTTDLPS